MFVRCPGPHDVGHIGVGDFRVPGVSLHAENGRPAGAFGEPLATAPRRQAGLNNLNFTTTVVNAEALPVNLALGGF